VASPLAAAAASSSSAVLAELSAVGGAASDIATISGPAQVALGGTVQLLLFLLPAFLLFSFQPRNLHR